MTTYRFTLEAVGPECSDNSFSEWVAALRAVQTAWDMWSHSRAEG